MPAAGISTFTSDKAQARFARAYEGMRRRRWPAEATVTDVATSFGSTRAYRIGSEGVPFVLLSGAGGNALSWHRYMRPFAATRQVIVLDPVGEPGCSVQERPLHDGRDWANWLHETLTALDVERVHLVGMSHGGWVALQYNLHLPGHADTITLLDPAGFGRLNGRFLAWIMMGGLAAFSPTPIRRLAARALHNSSLLDDDLVRLLRASTGFRRRHIAPPEITDEELRRITAPTLALLGGRSQMYDAQAVAAQIRAQIPNAHAETIPEAGHDLPVRCPELVSNRTIQFTAATEKQV